MDLKDIKTIVQLISKSGLKEFEYQSSDFKIRIKNAVYLENQKIEPLVALKPSVSATAPADVKLVSQQQEKSDNKYLSIRSPMIGTFYERPAPDKEAFVKVGDKIQVGQTVCIIEAMKLFNEIESEVSGCVVKVLVENASPVEYDQPLFLVDPS